jgi:hypothetical protein
MLLAKLLIGPFLQHHGYNGFPFRDPKDKIYLVGLGFESI